MQAACWSVMPSRGDQEALRELRSSGQDGALGSAEASARRRRRHHIMAIAEHAVPDAYVRSYAPHTLDRRGLRSPKCMQVEPSRFPAAAGALHRLGSLLTETICLSWGERAHMLDPHLDSVDDFMADGLGSSERAHSRCARQSCMAGAAGLACTRTGSADPLLWDAPCAPQGPAQHVAAPGGARGPRPVQCGAGHSAGPGGHPAETRRWVHPPPCHKGRHMQRATSGPDPWCLAARS